MRNVDLDKYKRQIDAAKRKDRKAEKRRRESAVDEDQPPADALDSMAKDVQEKTKITTNYEVANYEVMSDILKWFTGHAIRRTINSPDWQGRPIWGALPPHISTILLNMTDEELNVISKRAKESANDKSFDWCHVSFRLFCWFSHRIVRQWRTRLPAQWLATPCSPLANASAHAVSRCAVFASGERPRTRSDSRCHVRQGERAQWLALPCSPAANAFARAVTRGAMFASGELGRQPVMADAILRGPSSRVFANGEHISKLWLTSPPTELFPLRTQGRHAPRVRGSKRPARPPKVDGRIRG